MARSFARAVALCAFALASAALADALPETTLPLRLVGTVVAARADRSLAVVESAGATRLVRKGESIGGARIEEIGKDSVVLAYASRRERLSFGAPGAAGVVAASTSAEMARAHGPSGHAGDSGRDSERSARAAPPSVARTRALPSTPVALRASFQKGRTNDEVLADIAQQARFQPLLDGDGKLRGVALLGIVPDSMLERFGLQSGDVVTHIAGVKVDNTANAYNTLRGLNLANGVEVTVMRRGAETTVNVPGAAF